MYVHTYTLYSYVFHSCVCVWAFWNVSADDFRRATHYYYYFFEYFWDWPFLDLE